MNRKTIWILSIILVAAAIYYFIGGVEKEMSRIEVVPDGEVLQPIFSGELSDIEEWRFDAVQDFFIEYRLERDRIRGQEKEMLNDMIDNPRLARRHVPRQRNSF